MCDPVFLYLVMVNFGKEMCFLLSKLWVVENLFIFAEYKVHAYNRNGLCAVGFMDDHYPVRSAFSLLNKVRIRALFLRIL